MNLFRWAKFYIFINVVSKVPSQHSPSSRFSHRHFLILLLNHTEHSYYASTLGNRNLIIIDVTCIKAVIAMIPHPLPAAVSNVINANRDGEGVMEGERGTTDGEMGTDEGEDYYYLVERPGLDVAYLGGSYEVS